MAIETREPFDFETAWWFIEGIVYYLDITFHTSKRKERLDNYLSNQVKEKIYSTRTRQLEGMVKGTFPHSKGIVLIMEEACEIFFQ